MREPGGPERLDGAVVQRRGPAQRDAGRDPARLVVAARLERGPRAVAEAIEHALNASAAPEHGQGAGGQRLVDALACEPGAPVEALGGRRHLREAPADLHDRALLQRSGRAQLDRMAVEARDRGAAEGAGPGLALDHESRLLHVPDARSQGIGGARCDAVHRPGRAHDRTGHGERPGEAPDVAAAQHEQKRRQQHERDPEWARAGERRARQAGREPRRGHETELVDAITGAHSASCGRSDSSLTGPMPLTSSSSSIEPNPPWEAR